MNKTVTINNRNFFEKKFKSKNLILFIPARSGSTRIKNKNLKKIGKKSLIQNKIKSCLETNLGPVIVSTNSKKIAKLAKRSGAIIPYLRPKIISNSNSSMVSSVIHLVKFYYKKKIKLPKYIGVFPSTNPFVKKKSIIESFNKIKKYNKFNSITSIYKSNDDPFLLIDKKKKKILFNIFNYKNLNFSKFERSQDRPTFFKLSSSIQITKTKYFYKFFNKDLTKLREEAFDIKSCTSYEISKKEAYDINTSFDLILLKYLKSRKKITEMLLNR